MRRAAVSSRRSRTGGLILIKFSTGDRCSYDPAVLRYLYENNKRYKSRTENLEATSKLAVKNDGKSTAVLKKHIFIENCSKAARKN
jgi:hypothetical protein